MKTIIIKTSTFLLLFLGSVSFSIAQNAITLDPNTSGNNKARTLSEGVGVGTENLIIAKPFGGQYNAGQSKLGIKSITTTSTSELQTALFGRATHSSTYNRGLWAEAEAQGSATAMGGAFSSYGNSSNILFGLFSSANNQGNGGVMAGYFSVVNVSNSGRGSKFGVQIANSVGYNDTTTVQGRYGLYSTVSGKTQYSSYGIFANNGNGDTVTNNYSRYGIYSIIEGKNKSINSGISSSARNSGEGEVIAGSFEVLQGSSISKGNRVAIKALNISSDSDTVTVNNRVGVSSIINGRSKYSSIAIRGENSNYYGDTLSVYTRVGVLGYANGKSKSGNVGLSGSAYSNVGTTTSATAVEGYVGANGSGFAKGGSFNAYTQNTSTGSHYGVYSNAANYYVNNSSDLYGAYYGTYSSGNNQSRALYADAFGASTSSNIIVGVNSIASSNNTANFNPTYGIYTQAGGASSGNKYGIYSTVWGSGIKYAGYFEGNVHVNGTLSKSGGTFKIDHPQDPENKYLVHSFVESPEMKNIYDGVATTNANGDATITMPTYFQALNVSFRYQLTCMGQFAQAIVQEEIIGNVFKIKTDKPNVKVSWQVTGVRNDEWAKANPIVVEQAKEKEAVGKYLNPEVFKQTASKGIHAVATTETKDYEKEAKENQARIAAEQKQRENQVKENIARKKQQDEEDAQRAKEQKRMEDERSKANEVKK